MIDANITQLVTEIERAQAYEGAMLGLSISRHVEDGVATWGIHLGLDHNMTIFDSQTDYRGTPAVDIAAEIIRDWDAEWDD
jgi:hypothetical protein